MVIKKAFREPLWVWERATGAGALAKGWVAALISAPVFRQLAATN